MDFNAAGGVGSSPYGPPNPSARGPMFGTGLNPYMMMGQMGATALGEGFNYFGAKAGTESLMHEQNKFLEREGAFDQQRQAQLGQYVHDNFATPVGQTEAAGVSDAARVASGAVNPNVAGAAGNALGVKVPGGMLSNPGQRVALNRAGAGQREARMGQQGQQMNSDFSEIERQRNLMEALEPFEQQRAAQTGHEARQIGGFLMGIGGAGGGGGGA